MYYSIISYQIILQYPSFIVPSTCPGAVHKAILGWVGRLVQSVMVSFRPDTGMLPFLLIPLIITNLILVSYKDLSDKE